MYAAGTLHFLLLWDNKQILFYHNSFFFFNGAIFDGSCDLMEPDVISDKV